MRYLTILSLLTALAASLVAPTAAQDSTIRIISWNVESGGAAPDVIAQQIAAFQDVDLWGLSEVNSPTDAATFETAAGVGEGAEYDAVVGTTGGGDRLVALYDNERFDLLGFDELDELNIGGNVRAALVLTLTETTAGETFIFMVNHLYRTNDDARHAQAEILNLWAARQSLPVIATGDYNFDYAVDGSSRDDGFDLMTAKDRWTWVKPDELVTTQCSGWPCAFNSVLDFVFVAGPAKLWSAASTIIVRDGDFPDDATTSDHRPVEAVFVLGGETPRLRVFVPSVGRNYAPGTVPTQPPADTPTVTPTATNAGPTATPTPTATQNQATPTPTATATQPQATATPTATATTPPAGPTETPTPTTVPGASNVRIQEILYNPAGLDSEGERVTIRNIGAFPIEMTGWKLSDVAEHTFTFPPFTLGGGADVNVWIRSGVNTGSDLYWGRDSATWNNDGDTAYLSDAGGNQVDVCVYSGGGSLALCE